VSIDALQSNKARIITALIGALAGAFGAVEYQEATGKQLCPCMGVVMEQPTPCPVCMPVVVPCPDTYQDMAKIETEVGAE
jgi:hypothetical protein